MKAERPQPRRKTEALSVDWDETVVRRPRKKAASTSTLFRNVIIGLLVVAAGVYALSQRYDLARLLVIDLNNPAASLAPAPSTSAPSATSAPTPPAASRTAGHGNNAPSHAPAAAPSNSVALPAQINVAPVYLGKDKDHK
jgi:hypothetical protein